MGEGLAMNRLLNGLTVVEVANHLDTELSRMGRARLCRAIQYASLKGVIPRSGSCDCGRRYFVEQDLSDCRKWYKLRSSELTPQEVAIAMTRSY